MGWPISDRYFVAEPYEDGSAMQAGNAAAIPPARNAATFNFCQASRSLRTTTAILVSNCMLQIPYRHSGARAERANPESRDPRCALAHLRSDASASPRNDG